MSGGPWEDYARPAERGPWDDYAKPAAEAPSVAGDVAKSAGVGLARGLIQTPGALYDAYQAVAGLGAKAGNTLRQKVGLAPIDPAIMAQFDQPMPGSSAYTQGLIESQTGKFYEPQTVAGEYARTVGEFAPGAVVGPAGRVARAASVVLPALASETAGQATKGSAFEPYARAGAALAAGGVQAFAERPAQALASAGKSLDQVPVAQREAVLARAQSLLDDARASGVPLSTFNAIDAASNGVTDLSKLQRHVEALGGMRGFYAQLPEGIEGAGRARFDTITPPTFEPSTVGPQIGAAAEEAVRLSPQGRALTQARRDAGPDVTALQAGEVIQPSQRAVYDARVMAREDAAAPLYREADAAPERIGVDRMLPVERQGEPVVTQAQYSRPQFAPDAPAPLERPAFDPIQGETSGESLARFVARNGGIDLTGDARAADLQRFNIPGLGPVARQGGKSIDNFWREHLVDHGYLKPDADGGAARDVTNELLRLLQNEQRAGQSGARFPIYSERTAARTASSQSDEFRNASELWNGRLDEDLTRAGVDPASVHPDLRSRAMGALMRGETNEPLDAYERAVNALREPPAPFSRTPTVQEETYAPRFGQVNPQSVLDFIDQRLATGEKGQISDALETARGLLFERGTGQTDLSVKGLRKAREAINAELSGKPRNVQEALLSVRNRLDAALASAPEYERARSTYEQFSRPLDVFGEGRAPGRIVERDEFGGRFNLPPERVAREIDAGPSAARDLRETGDMASRQAYEGYLRTRILDAASEGGGNVSAERLRAAMRNEADQLAQFPDVQQQLESIARAREGLAIVERSRVGQLARRDLSTEQAVRALFPTQPLANSEREIAQAVGQLAQRNPRAARELVRIHAETTFNEAMSRVRGAPNQGAGIKFDDMLLGNPQQQRNFYASLRSLPQGDVVAQGFERLMDVLAAGGQRQAIGTRTAYNAEELQRLKQGNVLERGAANLAAGGIKLPARIIQRIEEWRLGRNLDALARLAEDPDAIGAFRGLVNASANGGNIAGPLGRLVAITSRGSASGGLASQPSGANTGP